MNDEPTLDHEDEDFGEWDEPHCQICGHIATGALEVDVASSLLGG